MILCPILETSRAQEKSEEVFCKQHEIVVLGRNITIEKDNIDKNVTNALEQLKAAKSSIMDFAKKSVTTLLDIDIPSDNFEVIGECFLILKSNRDTSWKTVREAMLEEAYFQSLVNIDCDLITLEQTSQCKSHLKVSSFES